MYRYRLEWKDSQGKFKKQEYKHSNLPKAEMQARNKGIKVAQLTSPVECGCRADMYVTNIREAK